MHTNAVLIGVLLLSAALNFWNIDFPLGFHVDEPNRVQLITEGRQNFSHPLLLLQLSRVATGVVGPDDPQGVVETGRAIQAVSATGTVLLSYVLARRRLGPVAALPVAAAVAVSPMLVMHAHYLKEDTLLTTWLLASLIAFATYVKRPGCTSAAWLGLSAGLAFSSHYKSILLVPLCVVAPLFGALGNHGPAVSSDRIGRFYRPLVLAGVVATVVFLLVNWPLLLDLPGFYGGASEELLHAIEGEDARIRPLDFWFGYHLFYSLAPGMGWPALAGGLAGVVWALARWGRSGFEEKLLVVFALLFYFVPEMSPLKSERYVVPVVPILLQLGWWSVYDASLRLRSTSRAVLWTVAIAALVAAPLYRTVRLAGSIDNDTRTRADAWVARHGGNVLVEMYGGLSPNIWSAADVDLQRAREDGVDSIVTSSFMYDRYLLGSRLPNQDDEIYRIERRYQELFRYPYVEIRPDYESYGFNNPVIRIVDIRVPRPYAPAP